MRQLEEFEKTYVICAIEYALQVQDVCVGCFTERPFTNQSDTLNITFTPSREKHKPVEVTVRVDSDKSNCINRLIETSISTIANRLKGMYVYKHRGGKENG